jgi:hypothetical protein
MSDKIDLVKSWFKIANDDILVAQQLMRYEDPVLRSICFHCQQAVEARYPDPENGISLEKAKDAIFIALEVRRRILQKVII